MRRKRDPALPTNIYKRGSRYYGYLTVNGVWHCTRTFGTIEEAVAETKSVVATRRMPRYISIYYSSAERKWRVRIGPDRRGAGYFPTWDQAWEAALKM